MYFKVSAPFGGRATLLVIIAKDTPQPCRFSFECVRCHHKLLVQKTYRCTTFEAHLLQKLLRQMSPCMSQGRGLSYGEYARDIWDPC